MQKTCSRNAEGCIKKFFFFFGGLVGQITSLQKDSKEKPFGSTYFCTEQEC